MRVVLVSADVVVSRTRQEMERHLEGLRLTNGARIEINRFRMQIASRAQLARNRRKRTCSSERRDELFIIHREITFIDGKKGYPAAAENTGRGYVRPRLENFRAQKEQK